MSYSRSVRARVDGARGAARGRSGRAPNRVRHTRGAFDEGASPGGARAGRRRAADRVPVPAVLLPLQVQQGVHSYCCSL